MSFLMLIMYKSLHVYIMKHFLLLWNIIVHIVIVIFLLNLFVFVYCTFCPKSLQPFVMFVYEKWKCVIFMCYSSEKLITLNTLHEVVPTWYSFHSWVDWSNADKVSCSRKKHTDAGVRTVYLCIKNRHANH